MIRTGTFAYVKLHQIEAYHKAGWMIVDDMRGLHHGEYAVVMWKNDCICNELCLNNAGQMGVEATAPDPNQIRP